MLEFKNINKWFGNLQANKDVCLKVKKASIHGIIGENGAGKSTLMSILYGFYQADSGAILLEGKEVKIPNSKTAISLGIGMVHQHFMLIDTFNAVENILLGAEENFLLSKSYNTALEKIQQTQKDYRLAIPLETPIENLPVGEKQKVEIFKALYRQVKILILDEPTGVLTPQEAIELFKILKILKKDGVSILLITHKLKEILEVTDRVTVMRKGEAVETLATAKTNAASLAKLMVGREVLSRTGKRKKVTKKKILEVKNLNYKDAFGVSRLKGIQFELFSGEIVGVAGVSGNGQSELLELLAGMLPLQEGEIWLDQDSFTAKNSYDAKLARKIGIMHIPEDRLGTGMVKDFEAMDNNILGYQRSSDILKNRLLQPTIIKNSCYANMEKFDVRPVEPNLRLGNFSGGNQQKLLFSREMEKNSKVFLVGQPTRGVDVGAIEAIHQKLIEKRNEGKAIFLVSAELDEILTLSDRIMVMFHGEIVGKMSSKEATTQKLGLLMGGKK